jgi:endonuclease YncB( thermonuclease family)
MKRLSLLMLLALLGAPAAAATVVSVGDGDTMRVVDGGMRFTIRLACVDAPETAQRPYGASSRQQLQQLAPIGSAVTLRPQTIDKYGRTVAEVFRNGQSINLAMVSSGQAFAYRKYLAACDGSVYLGAEAAAQRQRVGVWAVPGGIQRPWDWRHGARPPSATSSAPFIPAGGASAPAAAPAGGYSGSKLTCRQIGSFARAQELLRQGHTYLDKNGDGVACESLR